IVEEARQEGSLADVLSRAGFSTAGEVTDLAGRGVGLDAVKAHVHSLGGRVEVSSEPGHGMSVSLLLPVALALLKVLLIQRGGAVYGLPIAGVEEVVTVDATTTLQGRVSLDLRGRSLPLVRGVRRTARGGSSVFLPRAGTVAAPRATGHARAAPASRAAAPATTVAPPAADAPAWPGATDGTGLLTAQDGTAAAGWPVA